MIEEHEQFILYDKKGKNNLTLEVNWRPEDEDLNEAKVIRVKLPQGEEAYISKEELNAFLFVIGKPSEQRKMIPATITRVRHYSTTVNIMATRDVKKGEIIRGPVTITLPSVAEEIIGEVAKNAKNKAIDDYDFSRLFGGINKHPKQKNLETTYINETKQGIKKDE